MLMVNFSHHQQSYVQRLEERVAELEALLPQENLDHLSATQAEVGQPAILQAIGTQVRYF